MYLHHRNNSVSNHNIHESEINTYCFTELLSQLFLPTGLIKFAEVKHFDIRPGKLLLCLLRPLPFQQRVTGSERHFCG